jgi:hypothetical protein
LTEYVCNEETQINKVVSVSSSHVQVFQHTSDSGVGHVLAVHERDAVHGAESWDEAPIDSLTQLGCEDVEVGGEARPFSAFSIWLIEASLVVVWAILEAVIERRTNKRRIQGDSSRPYTHAIFSTPQDNCIHLLRLATHLLPLSRGYPRVFNASYTELPHLTAATHVRQDRAADANTAFPRFHEQESFVFGNDSQTVVTCGTCLGRFAGKILVSLGVQVSEDDSLISAFYWSTIMKAQQL